MATLTINAFYTNGVDVDSCNSELNKKRAGCQSQQIRKDSAHNGFLFGRTNGILLMAHICKAFALGYNTRTFTAPNTVTVFLPPKPVKHAKEFFSLKVNSSWMQLLPFMQSEARVPSLLIMLQDATRRRAPNATSPVHMIGSRWCSQWSSGQLPWRHHRAGGNAMVGHICLVHG